jgi:formate dehydrogenase assembly factor FdhD
MSTGATPKGYPFPHGDDPIANGDNVIAALATAIDTKQPMAWTSGAVNTAALAANTGVSVAVTFPVGRFNAAPQVVASHVSNGYTFAALAAPTATGVSIKAFNPAGSATSGTGQIQYIAVQMTATGGPG